MPKKTQMTDRIYAYLREVIPRQGYAPSVREICEAVGLKSPSTVNFHLKRLQERGLIEKARPSWPRSAWRTTSPSTAAAGRGRASPCGSGGSP